MSLFFKPKLHALRRSLICGRRHQSIRLTRKTKRGTTDHTSRENILQREILDLLKDTKVDPECVRVSQHLIEKFRFSRDREEVFLSGVEIIAQTAEAEGLALVPRSYYTNSSGTRTEQKKDGINCIESVDIVNNEQVLGENKQKNVPVSKTDSDEPFDGSYTVIKVPKTVLGDIVEVKLKRHHQMYAEADLVKVLNSRHSKLRNDSLVVCPHFSLCLGCQVQMLSYDNQLVYKQSIIKKAYRYFYPGLDTANFDEFGWVIGSPMQYSYRTKLTPHASIPRKTQRLSFVPHLGFEHVNSGNPIVDIDECVIAVPTINKKLTLVRALFFNQCQENIEGKLDKKIRPTFLLRDSAVQPDLSDRECLTGPNSIITETVDKRVFQFLSNDFFQNNRSILPTFLDFLRYQLSSIDGLFKYIIDSYCGSGFLGISLSDNIPSDGKVFGIEISESSVEYARHNARLNGLSDDIVTFVAGNSDDMFANSLFKDSQVKGAESVLLMNPSRKGSSKVFLKQVLEFKPKMIIYVSCNVFTQARDLKDFEDLLLSSDAKYKLESVTGFDFYPQTKHVESVAVLKLVE